MVELAGFPTCYNDELDPASDNTYIIAVRNGENEAGWPGARARIIHWHLEFHVEYGPWAGIAETWSPDAWHARTIGARYVPMGGDARLNEGTNGTAQAYDVAYLGYIVNRRNDVLTDLKAHGLRVSPTGAWGQERHAILTHSKAVSACASDRQRARNPGAADGGGGGVQAAGDYGDASGSRAFTCKATFSRPNGSIWPSFARCG